MSNAAETINQTAAPVVQGVVMLNSFDFMGWATNLRRKNGFNLLAKKDRQILNSLIDEKHRTLQRQERDTPSFRPPCPPTCGHGKTMHQACSECGRGRMVA